MRAARHFPAFVRGAGPVHRALPRARVMARRLRHMGGLGQRSLWVALLAAATYTAVLALILGMSLADVS
jgi:hypothetical protein